MDDNPAVKVLPFLWPDLINELQQYFPEKSFVEIKDLAESCSLEIKRHLCEGGRVEIRGFGTFSVRTRPARQAHNPKTGEHVKVGKKARVHFKPSRLLRQGVDQ